jgi:HEAT repeat protein
MKTILPSRIAQLTVTVLLTLTTCAQASRRHRPMGDYVREAGLIVVADTRKGGERGFHKVVSITEVIKGDPTAAGTEILLDMMMSTADARVSAPATNVTILLKKDWEEQKRWPVLEAYTKAEEAAAVRTLVGIYRLPGERQQLLALREKTLAGNTYHLAQLLADLRNMREPSNFDVMVDLYDVLVPIDQTKLVEIMARTGDPRAVPPLLKAMQSSDQKVSTIAARRLSWDFPGAPNVTKAFEEALMQKHLAREAARYLSKRRDDPALNEIRGVSKTQWRRATRLWEAGDTKAARAAYLAIVEDGVESGYTRRSAATRLLPNASASEKERIRKALLPQLLADARAGNYLEKNRTAHILRELHHVDCLEALLALTSRIDLLIAKTVDTATTATLAIRELGPEARQQAVTRLIEDLGAGTVKTQGTRVRTLYLLELIWIGDKESLGKVADVMPDSWLSTWTALHPLRLAADGEDEGAALVRVLAKPVDLPSRVREWVAFCLGDMKEKRAVKALTETLTCDPDWRLTRAARDALICIGGPEVEKEMLKLLTHEDHNRVRRAATEVLFRLQGASSCDLARRMLHAEDFGRKHLAMTNLGTFGTVDDLTLLLPYCDYWKADRATHYWAMTAVSTIRERYNYDVNGPIVKTSDKK